MIPHVTEMQLDLYLDGGLDPEERLAVEAHLVTCAACRQRLASMRPLFQALADLAVPMPEGFAHEVMVHIPESRVASGDGRRELGWLVPALEGVASLALLVLLAARFGDLVAWPPAGWLSTAAGRLATALEAQREMLWQSAASLPAWLSSAASSLPGPLPLDLTTVQMGLALVAVTALWLVGNSVLLRGAALNGNDTHQEV